MKIISEDIIRFIINDITLYFEKPSIQMYKKKEEKKSHTRTNCRFLQCIPSSFLL